MELIKDIVLKYFSKQTVYEPLNEKQYILIESMSTQFLLSGEFYKILARKGFIWDGATIPRFLWSLIGYHPAGLMLAPSLWHDLIYVNKGVVYNYISLKKEFISRLDCDRLFLSHMIRMGVEEKKALKMYKVIRIFGRFYWFDKTNNIFIKKGKVENGENS